MNQSIKITAAEIDAVLDHGLYGFWLYGSVVLDDFRPGWSDIDFIALVNGPIREEQAKLLLTLRQTLSEQFPDDPFFRCFEGVIADLSEYRNGQFTRLVYWGTTGQRITDRFEPDAFSRYELAYYGRSVWGVDDRSLFSSPDSEELREAVEKHCRAIRSCARQTDESLYSCGWLLDIARGLYTLRRGGVIGKTQAGLWALEEHVFPDEEPLKRALEIRKRPLEYKDRPETRAYLRSLGPTVQQYADVLERELNNLNNNKI